jgi:hypothetical protein
MINVVKSRELNDNQLNLYRHLVNRQSYLHVKSNNKNRKDFYSE